MKRYLLTLLALAAACAATARTARPTRAELERQTERVSAEADSLRTLTDWQAAQIDSLCQLLAEQAEMLPDAAAPRTASAAAPARQSAADSLAELRRRLRRVEIESVPDVSESAVIDTLDSGNEALFVVLYGDNTWRYVRNREIARDSTIFEKYWDTTTLFPYKDANLAAMPSSVVLELVDSTRSYHCPYQATPHRADATACAAAVRIRASTCR